MTRTATTHWLAVLSITLAGVGLTGCSLLGTITGEAAPNEDGSSTTDVFTIMVGDCLNNGGTTGEVSDVAVIDCQTAHDSEAFTSVMMADGDFPGETAVAAQAVSECTSAFTNFVGLDYESSSLDFSYYHPTEESWASNDREILCVVLDPKGKTTGTLEAAAK